MMRLIEFTEGILEKSWIWLNDSEIKHLTNTPDFTKESQREWFDNLPKNHCYWVKGIEYNNEVIGVAGIKFIDLENKKAEYFGYIGDKNYWGKGLSEHLFPLIYHAAINNFGLKELYLNVIPQNTRAIKAYEKAGFKVIESAENNVLMSKQL